MNWSHESDIDEMVGGAVDAAEALVLENLDEAVEKGLDEVIDASIEIVDEHFDHLTGNEKADKVVALAADWLQSKGVELLEDNEDQIKESLAAWVQDRFDDLKEKIEEWRRTRPERKAFRASQKGKSRAERKEARRARRASR